MKSCPPLDLNSSYLYFLQASHFADTCILAKQNNKIVGFISAYIRPDEANNLFIWQVAVAEEMRGQGLAKQLLNHLIMRPHLANIDTITTTISPSNLSSQAVFRKMAQHFNCDITVTSFLDSSIFGQDTHEAEDLYTLKSAQATPLIKCLQSQKD
ncbi:diaminobutyrate acetyltransferase [Thiosulfativibrio zosterae]|uniref:L-2,4-diaminobutyric acid acetyltransferase n=1 Tax=Thiosulfativibrio zosterae TaxID=2675053 RepID=A0A6F8PNM8_9GAMM|nr:L-2,4-diaminobutyric acid acetyltransferase [Thiosulfativibrio zosterae]